jgi:hypothetical protein
MKYAAARARKRRGGKRGVRGSGRGGAGSGAAQPPPHGRVLTVEEGQRVIAAALFSAAELTDMSLETQN